MRHGQGSAGQATSLAELVAGMGLATPAPLFFIDEDGRTHALNELAHALPEDHPAAEAFLSPVDTGADRRGHVVAYVDPSRPQDEGDVVAALVALTAEVVGRNLRTPRDAEPPLPPGAGAVELALQRLAELTEVDALADVLADAATAAAGAERAAVFVRRDDGALEPRAARGVKQSQLRRIRAGAGILGWAALRGRTTAVPSPFRLPAAAPREEGRHGPLATWLATPFALVPLASGAQVVGLLAVSGIAQRGGRDAAQDAGARLERLAEKAGSALAGALVVRQARREERVQRELEIARQIQRRLLPARAVAFPGLQLAGECRAAAQVGGDWYGFRAVDDETLIASLFDVAGHGIGAAFCMTLVRSALRAELARGGSPAEVLARTNELAAEDLAESGLFATAFLARFNRREGRLDYASAGHARPIHWSAAERRFVTHAEGGLPLGLFADSRYAEGSVGFAEGDLLVLYTDGIVEAENARGETFGRDRLLGLVRRLRRRPAAVALRAIWREIERFAGGRALRDDATLVVVRGARGFGSRDERSQGTRRAGAAQARPGRKGRSGAPRIEIQAGSRRG